MEKINNKEIDVIIYQQALRWRNEILSKIYDRDELISKIEDDFLSENDIADSSEFFDESVDFDAVCDRRREECKKTIRFHYPDCKFECDIDISEEIKQKFENMKKVVDALHSTITLIEKLENIK